MLLKKFLTKITDFATTGYRFNVTLTGPIGSDYYATVQELGIVCHKGSVQQCLYETIYKIYEWGKRNKFIFPEPGIMEAAKVSDLIMQKQITLTKQQLFNYAFRKTYLWIIIMVILVLGSIVGFSSVSQLVSVHSSLIIRQVMLFLVPILACFSGFIARLLGLHGPITTEPWQNSPSPNFLSLGDWICYIIGFIVPMWIFGLLLTISGVEEGFFGKGMHDLLESAGIDGWSYMIVICLFYSFGFWRSDRIQ